MDNIASGIGTILDHSLCCVFKLYLFQYNGKHGPYSATTLFPYW